MLPHSYISIAAYIWHAQVTTAICVSALTVSNSGALLDKQDCFSTRSPRVPVLAVGFCQPFMVAPGTTNELLGAILLTSR